MSILNRDFEGYGRTPPNPDWPDNARVAVSIVINLEEGAELNLAAGDERNESMHEFNFEVSGTRDLCMESHFEYGSRVGYWRIVELLEQYDVTTTINACVRALETTPLITRDIVERGYEIMCHGYRWEPQLGFSNEEERALIERCTARIEELTGTRPLGWHAKSYASVNTRQLLADAGYLYDSNVYNDDLPWAVAINQRPYICLPYSFDTNDMRFQNNGGFTHADDFFRYCADAFDWLWEQGEKKPAMLTIALHTRIIGRPARIAGLKKLLAHMRERDRVWFAQRKQIAQHWLDKVLPGLEEST